MKKIIFIISIVNLILLSIYFFGYLNNLDFKLNDPPNPGNLANPGIDPESVSINGYVFFLAAIGVGYVYGILRALNLKKI